MTDIIITTRDYGVPSVAGMDVVVVALPKSGRDRPTMRAWVASALAAYRQDPTAVLRAIIWELGSERPGGLRDLYKYTSERVVGLRWFLVAGNAIDKALAAGDPRVAGVNRLTMRRDVQVVVASELAAAIATMVWPVVADPMRGGRGKRRGLGPHVPWDLLVSEPLPRVDVRTTDTGAVRDADGTPVEAGT